MEKKLISDLDEVVLYDPIDTHVHGRWNEYINLWIWPKSTIEEAKKWWISHALFMPNTNPALIDMDSVLSYIDIIDGYKNWLYFWLRDDNLEIADNALLNPSVVWIKVYPVAIDWKSVTTSFEWKKCAVMDKSVLDWSTLDRIAKILLNHNKVISFHWETPWLWHWPEAEIDYVKNVIVPLAIKYPNLKLIVAHVSLKDTAELIINTNRDYSTNIYIELSAHHLTFNSDDIKWNTLLKCFPNIRHIDNVIYLRNLLKEIWKDPNIKIIFWSDHAPHPLIKKQQEFSMAPWWVPSIANALEAILTIWDNIWLTISQIQKLVSDNANELFNLFQNPSDKVKFIRCKNIPDDYYWWVVWNPFKLTTLNFKIKK